MLVTDKITISIHQCDTKRHGVRLRRAVRVIGQGAARLGVSCAVRSGDPDLSVNMGTLVNSLLLLRRLIVIAKITLNTNNTNHDMGP